MPDENSGKFFAFTPKKVTGQLTEQNTVYLLDETKRRTVWNVIVKLTGGIDYPLKKEEGIKTTKKVA